MSDEAVLHKRVLIGKLEQAIHDTQAHTRSGFHESPPCGGCHFYAGVWATLVELVPKAERAAWWERHDRELSIPSPSSVVSGIATEGP